jgi:hypothetical protein
VSNSLQPERKNHEQKTGVTTEIKVEQCEVEGDHNSICIKAGVTIHTLTMKVGLFVLLKIIGNASKRVALYVVNLLWALLSRQRL